MKTKKSIGWDCIFPCEEIVRYLPESNELIWK